MTTKIRCRLGLHRWAYLLAVRRRDMPIWWCRRLRECRLCGRRQAGIYDMCYGGTTWEPITTPQVAPAGLGGAGCPVAP